MLLYIWEIESLGEHEDEDYADIGDADIHQDIGRHGHVAVIAERKDRILAFLVADFMQDAPGPGDHVLGQDC